jgi:hypothetical protein
MDRRVRSDLVNTPDLLPKAAVNGRGLRPWLSVRTFISVLIKVITVLTPPFFINCAEPMAPLSPVWFPEITLPWFEITGITIKEEGLLPGVYMVGNTTTVDGEGFYSSYILKYDGYKLTKEFTLKYAAPGGVTFNNIKFCGDKGWLGGGKLKEAGGYEPLLISFDGRGWKEDKVTNNEVGSINAIYPIDGTSFWLVGNKESAVSLGGRVFKYERGGFKCFNEVGRVDLACYSPEMGFFYCFIADVTRRGNIINMTVDGGNTWFYETVPKGYLGYGVEDISDLAAFKDSLFLTCDFTHEFSGIIARQGPAGAGEYSLTFLSNNSGFFGGVSAATFEKTGRGLAVGNEASVLFDGRAWAIEKLPYPIAFRGIAASRENGFWAFGENIGAMGRWELLYHP